MSPRTADRLHAGLMRLSALVTVAYWVEYFTTGKVRTSSDRTYIEFENAFPLADGYMAACFFAAAHLLHEHREETVPVAIAAGSAMTYLAGMDILYNLEHHKFQPMSAAMAGEVAINLFSLIFGPFTMVRIWRARHRLVR